MVNELLRPYMARQYEIRQLKEKIETLEAAITAPGAQSLDGMPKGSVKNNDRIGTYVARLVELRERYEDLMSLLVFMQTDIENAIENLESEERLILRYKYIDGLTWYAISMKMGMSESTARRIHYKAIRHLERGSV